MYVEPAMSVNSPRHPTTPPRTPRKEAPGPQASQSKPFQNANAPEGGSKQKPRSRRPKNVLTSPPAAVGIPPPSAKAIHTPSAAAYAGPTFHSSPAPSALPIPSFYSKSVPESPGLLSSRKSASTSPPEIPLVKPEAERHESPLDIFFKADREEKARARSATQAVTKATGPFQPPPNAPRTSQTPPGSVNQTRPQSNKRLSSSGMFAMELDGDSGPGSPQPYGLPFSTPYAERMNAVRPKVTNGFKSASSIDGQRTESSEALKALLKVGIDASSSSGLASSGRENVGSPFLSSSPLAARQSPVNNSQRVLYNQTTGRSSGLRQEFNQAKTPTKTPDRNAFYQSSPTPTRIYDNFDSSSPVSFRGAQPPSQPAHHDSASGQRIREIDDGLRRILKLGGPITNTQTNNFAAGSHSSGMYDGVKGS